MADTSVEDGSISLPTRRFSVDEGEKIKLIACDDIRLIYAEKRRTFLVTLEGKTYPTHFSLIQFEQRLPAAVFFAVTAITSSISMRFGKSSLGSIINTS